MDRLLKKAKQKNRKQSGFTLAETLIAVLILLMVSVVVATGIPAASNAYRKVVVASNAEVLLSTTVNMLRNELGTAKNVSVASDKVTVHYYNASRGSDAEITCTGTGGIMLTRYAAPISFIPSPGTIAPTLIPTTAPEPLVSAETATEKLYITYREVEHAEGSNVITFKGLKVKQGNKEMTELKDEIGNPASLTIRMI